MDKGAISKYTIVFKTIDRLLVLDILQAEKKPRSRSLNFLFKIFQTRDIIYSEKEWDLLLTETENWELLVDCTSRDGRKMLEAGVHLSDKRTLLMKTHRPFQTQYNIF